MNPHAPKGTSPSSWRVCLFRHSDVGGHGTAAFSGSAQAKKGWLAVMRAEKYPLPGQPDLGGVEGAEDREGEAVDA